MKLGLILIITSVFSCGLGLGATLNRNNESGKRNDCTCDSRNPDKIVKKGMRGMFLGSRLF